MHSCRPSLHRLLLGIAAPVVVACGSGETSQMPSYAGGGPAHEVPTHDAGSGSSSGGAKGSGSSSGGESANTSGTDGGTPNFGNVVTASFTLVDTKITNDPIGSPVPSYDPIPYGAIIDLAQVGHELSIRANPPQVAQVGSMAFALDATFTHTANTSPYSLCGDDGKGKFVPCLFSVQKHELTDTTYSEPDLGGTPYQPTVFQFTIVDSAADAGTD